MWCFHDLPEFPGNMAFSHSPQCGVRLTDNSALICAADCWPVQGLPDILWTADVGPLTLINNDFFWQDEFNLLLNLLDLEIA